MQTRRHFLSGISTAALALWTERLSAAPQKGDIIIGHGRHRYRVQKDWVPAGQGRNHPILNCHEMVQVRDGRLFMIGDHSHNQMLVFHPNGMIQESWGAVWPGGHGLTKVEENGEEFLFVTDSGLWKSGNGAFRQTGRVSKIDLNGREIFSISHPVSVGAYEPKMFFNPTEVAVAPNGDIYVADGYGSNFVLRYDRNGKFISRFGGKEGVPLTQRLNSPHGIAVDTRSGAANATLLITSRGDNCFHRFSLEGDYLATIPTPGAFVCRPVIAGNEVYAGACWSKDAVGKFLPMAAGFVVVIDANDKVVAAPGAFAPEYQEEKLKPLLRNEDVFEHAHDVCVMENGDLLVCQWNAFQTYPVWLEKVAL